MKIPRTSPHPKKSTAFFALAAAAALALSGCVNNAADTSHLTVGQRIHGELRSR